MPPTLGVAGAVQDSGGPSPSRHIETVGSCGVERKLLPRLEEPLGHCLCSWSGEGTIGVLPTFRTKCLPFAPTKHSGASYLHKQSQERGVSLDTCSLHPHMYMSMYICVFDVCVVGVKCVSIVYLVCIVKVCDCMSVGVNAYMYMCVTVLACVNACSCMSNSPCLKCLPDRCHQSGCKDPGPNLGG